MIKDVANKNGEDDSMCKRALNFDGEVWLSDIKHHVANDQVLVELNRSGIK